MPGLRRFPDAAPGLQRDGRRCGGVVPDRLRHGRDHRLSHYGAPYQLHPQPVPERCGDPVGAGRDVPRAHPARRAPRLQGHHLRDDLRGRRHGYRHGPRARRGQPQSPHDDPRVRQPGLHEHRRAALVLYAVRPPHIHERGRHGAVGQALPPQGHCADIRRVPRALCVHRERGLSRGPHAQGREGAVVREERRARLRQDPLILSAQLAHD